MLHDRIKNYYGAGCDIVATRRTAAGDGFWFVVDAASRARLLRMLGTIDRHGAVMEQSAMDLLAPERLVFLYERLMLLAFGLARETANVLLLGLGGGAMCRHLAAYLPECAATAVERDAIVLALSRRYFRIELPVRHAEAEDAVADAAGGYDVILADLYDAHGLAALPPGFWGDCRAALRPGGCLAINWAGFRDRPQVQDAIADAKRALAGSIFLVDRSARPNMVQLLPLAGGLGPADLPARWRDFARRHKLPREDSTILQRCELLAQPPLRF